MIARSALVFSIGVLSPGLVYLLRELLLKKILLHTYSSFCNINFVTSIACNLHLFYFVMCFILSKFLLVYKMLHVVGFLNMKTGTETKLKLY